MTQSVSGVRYVLRGAFPPSRIASIGPKDRFILCIFVLLYLLYFCTTLVDSRLLEISKIRVRFREGFRTVIIGNLKVRW